MDANTAGRHLEALVADFSSAPHALCYAPSDVAVQDDPHVLRVLRLDDGQPFALEALTVADMKRLLIQANAAKLSALGYGARRLATEWAEQTGHLRLFMEDSEKAARQLGDSVAKTCYPIGPLRDAFLNVLNERGEYHAYVRKPVQWTADGIVKASKGIAKATKWSYRYVKRRMGKGAPQQDNAQIIPKDASPEALLIEHERKAFEANWPDFVSAVERALKTAKLSHEERADYEAEFHPGRFPTIEHKILADMAHEPIPDDYVAFCEASMRNALETRGRDTDLQWFSTALAALPAVVGVVVVVATGGGFGSEDLAIAGVTTATAPVWDRLMKLVGKDVAQRVRDEWIRQRGARIAEAALEASAPATRKAWDETVRESDMRVPQLRDCARALLHRVKETNHDGE